MVASDVGPRRYLQCVDNAPFLTARKGRRIIRVLIVALLPVSALSCFIVADRLFDLGIQYGDLGTWVGGLGSASAAGAAYVTLRQLLRNRNDQEADRRARALRRARRVGVRIEPTQTEVGPDYPFGWSVTVKNQSDDPIYEVRIGRALAALAAGVPARAVTMQIPVTADTHPSDFLGVGEVQEHQFISDAEIVNSSYGFVAVEFTDADGNRFRTVPADLSPLGKIVSRWIHADALSPSGQWRHSLNRVEPSSRLVNVTGRIPQVVYQSAS